MLELTHSVEGRRKRQRERELGGSINADADSRDWELDKSQDALRIKADHEDMHSLMMAYADMIGRYVNPRLFWPLFDTITSSSHHLLFHNSQ